MLPILRRALLSTRKHPRSVICSQTTIRPYKADAGDIASGDFVEVNGTIYEVVATERVRHNSRGSALCQIDLKDTASGKKHTERYRTEQKIEVAEIEPITITYKGKNGESGKLDFTDADGEDLELEPSWFGSAVPFLREGQEITLRKYESKPVGIQIYDGFVEFTVVETPEYRKGDQANPKPKNARLDTGAVIKVPTYVDNGDRIIIDIRKDPPQFERRIEE